MKSHRVLSHTAIGRLGLTLTLAAVALVWSPPPAQALEINDAFKVGLHLRTRAIVHTGRDGISDNELLDYVENRARVSFDAHPFDWGRAFIQVQDVRVWGEEANTLGDFSANGLDIHQAYLDLKPLAGDPDMSLLLRIGRQEIAWEGQRLIGIVGWTPQARSFDAARLMFSMDKSLYIDAFFAIVSKTESVAPGPATNPNGTDTTVLALNAKYRLIKDGGDKADISVTAIIDMNTDPADVTNRTRATIGARHEGIFGLFRYRLEGFVQVGDINGADISAFMLGARFGFQLKDPGIKVEFWADWLSGGSDAATAPRRSFNTLFATNHKFYGFSDFFINVPVHAQNKGLIDFALKSKFKIIKGLSMGLDIHYMLAANPRGGPEAWGWEIDYTAVIKPTKGLKLFVGVFTFVPGDAMAAKLGANDDVDLGFFSSIQADF